MSEPVWAGRAPLLVAAAVAVVVLGARWLQRVQASREAAEREPTLVQQTVEAAAQEPLAGPPPERFARTAEDAVALAIDDHDVYWATARGDVVRAPKAGGDSLVLAHAAGGNAEPHLAVDPAFLYWTAALEGGAGGALQRVSKSGGDVTTLATEPTEALLAVAADGDGVYWSTRPVGRAGPPTPPVSTADAKADEGGSLKKLSREGGGPVVLARGLATPCAIAVDADHVYWLSGASGSVWRVPKAGGDPVNLAAGKSSASCAIALDDAGVYWVERVDEPDLASSTLRRVAKTGGEARIVDVEPRPVVDFALGPDAAYLLALALRDEAGAAGVWRVPVRQAAAKAVQLARDRRGPRALVVDGTHAYWSGFGEGGEAAIFRVAR